jgi:hypothetical protein
MTLIRNVLLSTSLVIVSVFSRLASLFEAHGNYMQAKLLYRCALEISNKFLPSDHFKVRTLTKNYFLLLFKISRYQDQY